MKIRRPPPARRARGPTLVALWPTPAGAVPVFARKYGLNCTNCHSAFPRLNDWGQRFRANGYRLPGRENEEKTVLEGPAPFAMRTELRLHARVASTHVPDTVDRSGFRLTGLDILSAGVIAPHIGYLLVYPAADRRLARRGGAGGHARDGERRVQQPRLAVAERAGRAFRAGLRGFQREAPSDHHALRGLRLRLPRRLAVLRDAGGDRGDRARARLRLRRRLAQRLGHQPARTTARPTSTRAPPGRSAPARARPPGSASA